MFILSQDKDLLINGEKIISVEKKEKEIFVVTNKKDYCVGKYENIEETENAFKYLKDYLTFKTSYHTM